MEGTEPTVVGRSQERKAIMGFLTSTSSQKRGSSFYVSGCPGTGKTLCVRTTLKEWMKDLPVELTPKIVFVNAMGLKSPMSIWSNLAEQLKVTTRRASLTSFVGVKRKRSEGGKSVGEQCADIVDGLTSVISAISELQATQPTRKKPNSDSDSPSRTPQKRLIIIIDELDRLCPTLAASKNRKKASQVEIELLVGLLKIPSACASWVSLIGIANSVDLAVNLELTYGRKLFSECLSFSPYTSNQLKDILSNQNSSDSQIDNAAIEICVRKVAAFHGDARKALDVLKQLNAHQQITEAEQSSRSDRATQDANRLPIRFASDENKENTEPGDTSNNSNKVSSTQFYTSLPKKSDTPSEHMNHITSSSEVSKPRSVPKVSVLDAIKVLDNCYKNTFDSEVSLKALPLQQLMVLAAACNVAQMEPNQEEFSFVSLRKGLLSSAAALNLPPSQTSAGVSSLVDQAVALSQCGLLALKDPGKGRLGTWRLQVPHEALRQTLKHTHALIAKAVSTGDI